MRYISENYAATEYENLNDLKENDNKLYQKLISIYDDTREWSKSQLYVYESVEDFAIYEVVEGWYSYMFTNINWKGAPDLFNYIDYCSLGNALINTYDESVYCLVDDKIIESSYGFY